MLRLSSRAKRHFNFPPFCLPLHFCSSVCVSKRQERSDAVQTSPRMCRCIITTCVNIERMPGLPPIAGLGSRYPEFMVAPGTSRPAAIAAPGSLAALHSHFTPSRVCVTSGIAVSSLTSLSNCMSAQNFSRCMQQRLFIQRMNRGYDYVLHSRGRFSLASFSVNICISTYTFVFCFFYIRML